MTAKVSKRRQLMKEDPISGTVASCLLLVTGQERGPGHGIETRQQVTSVFDNEQVSEKITWSGPNFKGLALHSVIVQFNLGIRLPTLAVDQNHLECPLTLQLLCFNSTPLTTNFEALDVECIYWKTCIYFKLSSSRPAVLTCNPALALLTDLFQLEEIPVFLSFLMFLSIPSPIARLSQQSHQSCGNAFSTVTGSSSAEGGVTFMMLGPMSCFYTRSDRKVLDLGDGRPGHA
ncbi:hypothetical protein MJG53_008782 [Ovis ammon polii x Ovis aries]|uniref:Uncharacterized protein n=1 Tax=Ovis ammon polii x Ovis aries TaxID=2918886 RepID=A0ACB9UYE6_9CETA|nr:hypothetical protein MJT46_008412 [Ovis ammon polii x Ovis aries]KAI4582231.1 hypothetical protein MJG53_008782 [Ovis ammon polii x Ovis aries]